MMLCALLSYVIVTNLFAKLSYVLDYSLCLYTNFFVALSYYFFSKFYTTLFGMLHTT